MPTQGKIAVARAAKLTITIAREIIKLRPQPESPLCPRFQ